MKRTVTMLVGVVMLTLVGGIGGAWAEGKVNITREESKPKDVEVKVGEEVRFVNSAAQPSTCGSAATTLRASTFRRAAPGPR